MGQQRQVVGVERPRTTSQKVRSYRAPVENPYLSPDDFEEPTAASARRIASQSTLESDQQGRSRRRVDNRSHRPVRRRTFHWWYLLPAVVLVLIVLGVTVLPEATEEVQRGTVFPVRYSEQIIESSTRHNVDPYLVCAVIKTESGWDANAVSQAGALGLMQVMNDTSQYLHDAGFVNEKYDPKNLTEPTTNIEYGCALLGYLRERLSNEDEVIAAYNAGMGTVEQWVAAVESGAASSFEEIIDYPETSAYLVKVRDAKAEYQRLYPNGIGG